MMALTITPPWCRESRCVSHPILALSGFARKSIPPEIQKRGLRIDNGQCCSEVRGLASSPCFKPQERTMVAFTGFRAPLKPGVDATFAGPPRDGRTWHTETLSRLDNLYGARDRRRDQSCTAASRGVARQGRPFGRREGLSDEQADRQLRHQRQEREDRHRRRCDRRQGHEAAEFRGPAGGRLPRCGGPPCGGAV